MRVTKTTEAKAFLITNQRIAAIKTPSKLKLSLFVISFVPNGIAKANIIKHKVAVTPVVHAPGPAFPLTCAKNAINVKGVQTTQVYK